MPVARIARRKMRRLFRAMESELGPLIWPADHNHAVLPIGQDSNGMFYNLYREDCPACKAIYRHHATCECGHCPSWPNNGKGI